MVTNRNINPYPYQGEFYQFTIDDTLPLDEQTEIRENVCYVECDIQEGGDNVKDNSLHNSYNVYCKLENGEEIKVRKGMLFVGNQYGLVISGKVTSVVGSELGGFIAKVDTTEE